MERCPWTSDDTQMISYHDQEWGVPVYDDNKHFEFLTLESAQAGLSWKTILHRRDGYRQAFANFDPNIVASFGDAEVELLMNNPNIIRNRQKITAAVSNASKFLEVQKEFGSFTKYIWGFVGGKPIVNRFNSLKEIPAQSEEAVALSKDLKRRGFKFVGPVTIYAHMQAAGLVNDHLVSCPRHQEVQQFYK